MKIEIRGDWGEELSVDRDGEWMKLENVPDQILGRFIQDARLEEGVLRLELGPPIRRGQ